MIKEFFEIWKNVVFNPIETFQKLPKKGQIKNGSWFFIKVYIILFLVSLLFSIIMLPLRFLPYAFGNGTGALSEGFGVLISLLIMIVALPLIILFCWGLLFVGAGIIHLFVMMFGGKEPYRETFQVLAYSSAPLVAAGVPFIGFLTTIYVVILQVIGISKRQNLSIGKSIAVILLPAVIIGAIIVALIFATLALIFASVAGGPILEGLLS